MSGLRSTNSLPPGQNPSKNDPLSAESPAAARSPQFFTHHRTTPSKMDPERADESSIVARLSSSVSPVSDFPESAWPPSIPPGSELVSTALSSIAEGHAWIDPEKGSEKGGTHKYVSPVANKTIL